MSINRRMSEEGVVHIYDGNTHITYKRNKIMPFAATRMDLEILIMSDK